MGKAAGLALAPLTGGSSLLFTGIPGVGGQGLAATGLMGALSGKGTTPPSAGTPPAPPDPTAIAKQAALDQQRLRAAGASPSDITNVGGATGTPTSVLTGTDPSLYKNVLKGF